MTFKGRQVEFKGRRFDLLFRDRLGYTLVVELKKGFVKREHVGQLIEYYGVVNERGEERVRVMLVGSVIPLNLQRGMDGHGIEYRQLNDGDYVEFLKGKDPELLESLQKKRSQPIIVLKKPTEYVHIKPIGKRIGILWSHNERTFPRWLEQVAEGIKRQGYMWWSVGWKINPDQFIFPLIGYIWRTAVGNVTHSAVIERIENNPDEELAREVDRNRTEVFGIPRNPASPLTKYLSGQRKSLTLLKLIELTELPTPRQLKDFRLLNGDVITRPPQGCFRILLS